MAKANIYLIYFEWSNTKGNHAGMAYLADKLATDYLNVKLIKMISGKSKTKKAINLLYIWFIAIHLRLFAKNGDAIFLMEYLARSCFQDKLARLIKVFGVKGKLYGLVHLAGSHLMEIYHTTEVIKAKMDLLDECVVFGSSLSKFLKEEIGFNKVTTTYHYVDIEYYKPNGQLRKDGPLRVLCLGNIKRDFSALRDLVNSLPNTHFDICQGVMNLHQYFDTCVNVKLHGFLSEDELLKLMQENDICLSIMTDTVGSNVITTSLATGLILVVSDVGSIRDYCTTECSFLCKEQSDYRDHILYLSEHLEVVNTFRQRALERGRIFAYKNFKNEFEKIFKI
jgi:glycosyltransferase involved in cell wall biosynthesis